MTRTIITLSVQDKRWVAAYSARHGQSAAETIREAIRRLRTTDPDADKRGVLAATHGLWAERGQDAVETVDCLRNEWDHGGD